MRIILLILISLFFIVVDTSGQKHNYEFINYRVEDGLTSNFATCIFQDHLGYVWIGTANGLNRFDGRSFKNYYYSANDTQSLSNNFINVIYEDSNQNLWIGTRYGLNKYQRNGDSFHRYLHHEGNSISNNLINAIAEDDEGNIWLAGFDGIDKFSPLRNEFTNYRPYKGSNNLNWSVDMLNDVNGNLWVAGYFGGLFFFDRKLEKFTIFNSNEDEPYSISGNNCRQIHKDRYGNIWVGAIEGVNFYDASESQFLHAGNSPQLFRNISDNRILSVNEDNTGKIWLGTLSNGVSIFDIETRKVINLNAENHVEGLRNNSITDIYSDKQGGMWLATFGGGVSYYTHRRPAFYTYTNANYDSQEENVYMHAILPAKDGTIWAGTESGLMHFTFDGEIIEQLPYAIEGLNYADLQIFSLTYFSDQELWLGTNFGLYKYDIARRKFSKIDEIPDVFVNDINTEVPGKIFVATNKFGFYTYDRETKIFTQSSYSQQLKKNAASSTEIFDICVQNDTLLWLACRGGIDLYNMKTKTYKHYLWNPENPRGILSDQISKLLLDSNNNLWIGTINGLSRYSISNDQFKHYDIARGLPSNNVTSIEEDNNGNMWVSTEYGLCCIKKDETTFTFFKADGLQDNFFLKRSSAKMNDHYLLFGSRSGVTRFSPDSVFIPHKIDAVIINKLTILNEHAQDQMEKHYPENLVLKYFEASFSISFSAITFQNQYKIRYECMLKNVDTEFKQVGSQNMITYLNLNPGEYEFVVKAFNTNYPENAKFSSLKFKIKPPFWKTIWFNAFLVVLLIFIISIFFILRIRTIKRNKRVLERLVEDRTKEIFRQKEEIIKQAAKLMELNATKDKYFSIIAHDLKNPFQGIIYFADFLLNEYDKLSEDKRKEYIKSIRYNGEQTYNLVDNLLTWARSQTGRINYTPAVLNVRDFVRRVTKVMEINAANKEMAIIHNLPANLFVYGDINLLSTVLRNLLSNAIKFNYPGKAIHLTASRDDQFVYISLRDYGVGLHKDTIKNLFRVDKHLSTMGTRGEKGTGLGLLICKEFLERMGGAIQVESNIGKGAKFTCSIPVASGTHLENSLDTATNKEKQAIVPAINQEMPGDENTEKRNFFVLIIDDDDQTRKQLKLYLQDVFSVAEARNGKDGFFAAIKYVPDIVVVDLIMPEMDGMQFCKKLREDERLNHIPVILLTAVNEEESRSGALEAGADDYILKPFNPNLLKTRIQNLISLRNKLKEKFNSKQELTPGEFTINNYEEIFIERVFSAINRNISDPEFNVDHLAREIAMSRSLMYVKIKKITGKTANQIIRDLKMKRAGKLLRKTDKSILDISTDLGFKTQAHFSKVFTQYFNQTPIKYRKG